MDFDLYAVLGVAADATDDEIKKAYRRLARQYHPDHNPDDAEAEDRFKEISAAWSVLSDPEKRRQYDMYGAGGGPGLGDFAAGMGGLFEDLIQDMFGGGRRGRRAGTDLRYRLQISLAEVLTGAEHVIEFRRPGTCETCQGHGAATAEDIETCGQCHGRGQVRSSQGFFVVSRPCPQCRGRGQRIRKPCGDCNGQGMVGVDRKLDVQVPPGVQSGMRLRLRGEGEPGEQGAPPGDLYVELVVEEHPLFIREERHLLIQVPVPVHVALLGGEVEVPLLDGGIHRLEIEAGTETGSEVRLRGQGLPDLNSGRRGDLIIVLGLAMPRKLHRKERRALEQAFSEIDPDRYDAVRAFEKRRREAQDS